AATALCRDRDSYLRMRRFTLLLSGGVTLLLALAVLPGVYPFWARTLLGLPDDIAELTRLALVCFLPWPGTIGLRRLYQGVLIADDRTRRVTVGTAARLATMATSGFVLAGTGLLPGAAAGGLALSLGVTAEMLIAWRLARPSVRRLRALEPEEPAPSYGAIVRYYLPLAMTPLIALSVQPVVTFFLGRGQQAIESLAVLPVLYGLTFVFRALGLSYQEAAIALLGRRLEHRRPLGRFAFWLGLSCVGCLGLIAGTPLANLWLQTLSGLTPELSRFSRLPLLLMAVLPGLTVWITWQRSLLMQVRHTNPVSVATAVEAVAIVVILALTIPTLQVAGVVLAAVALTVGRFLGIIYLVPYVRRLQQEGNIST
ncbi:MAG: hypothetical protein D6794_03945, partial [Deltaproteobacteria bacterium]